MRNRPDFSDYVVHFTKETPPLLRDECKELSEEIIKLTALERIEKILKDNRIIDSNMPHTNAKAVCFTECTWVSLLAHAQRYSPYGIGFHKAFIFATGGGPVFYLRPDLFQFQKELMTQLTGKEASIPFHAKIWPFITPFVPEYAPIEHMKKAGWEGKHIDYTHEREWRVPHDLRFDIKKVQFVILNTYKDMAKFPKPIKDAIGRENFILMDNFKRIERLWPLHNIT